MQSHWIPQEISCVLGSWNLLSIKYESFNRFDAPQSGWNNGAGIDRLAQLALRIREIMSFTTVLLVQEIDYQLVLDFSQSSTSSFAIQYVLNSTGEGVGVFYWPSQWDFIRSSTWTMGQPNKLGFAGIFQAKTTGQQVIFASAHLAYTQQPSVIANHMRTIKEQVQLLAWNTPVTYVFLGADFNADVFTVSKAAAPFAWTRISALNAPTFLSHSVPSAKKAIDGIFTLTLYPNTPTLTFNALPAQVYQIYSEALKSAPRFYQEWIKAMFAPESDTNILKLTDRPSLPRNKTLPIWPSDHLPVWVYFQIPRVRSSVEAAYSYTATSPTPYLPGPVPSGPAYKYPPITSTSYTPAATLTPPTYGPATVAPPTYGPATVAPPTYGPATVAPPAYGPATMAPPTYGPATMAPPSSALPTFRPVTSPTLVTPSYSSPALPSYSSTITNVPPSGVGASFLSTTAMGPPLFVKETEKKATFAELPYIVGETTYGYSRGAPIPYSESKTAITASVPLLASSNAPLTTRIEATQTETKREVPYNPFSFVPPPIWDPTNAVYSSKKTWFLNRTWNMAFMYTYDNETQLLTYSFEEKYWILKQLLDPSLPDTMELDYDLNSEFIRTHKLDLKAIRAALNKVQRFLNAVEKAPTPTQRFAQLNTLLVQPNFLFWDNTNTQYKWGFEYDYGGETKINFYDTEESEKIESAKQKRDSQAVVTYGQGLFKRTHTIKIPSLMLEVDQAVQKLPTEKYKWTEYNTFVMW